MNAERSRCFQPYKGILGGKIAILKRIRRMAKRNRHYIPGCVWPITHRYHKKEFLLRERYVLYKAIFPGENIGLSPPKTILGTHLFRSQQFCLVRL